MSEKKSRQAGWLYTFFYPNRAYRYNEEQRKLKRKDDDLKLSRVFVLVYDIQSRDFQQACRNVMNDRRRAEQKSVEGFLPLHLALYERAPLQLLELLIDAYPAALKEYCPKNMLPLHIAARDHTILIVIMETIVRCYPPAVRVPDTIGDLPVQTSIRQRLPKEMTHLFLREYPEAINIKDKDGNTLLHMAIRFGGQEELIYALAKAYPEAVTEPNGMGDLPFHMACLFHGSMDLLKFLKGMNEAALHQKDSLGNLPIHLYFMQCRGGRPKEEVLQFFLEDYPGSVGVRNKDSCTPFQIMDKYYDQLEKYQY